MAQFLLDPRSNYAELDQYLKDLGVQHILLVCGASMDRLAIAPYMNSLTERLGIQVTRFSEFAPNPSWASCEKGTEVYLENGCDAVIAVGGGSAMDVGKCIALWSYAGVGRASSEVLLAVEPTKLVAIPTTAGTGSEATRFAVIYKDGKKTSIDDPAMLAQAVVLDGRLLSELPPYHRRATMMDALCHAIESFWSVNSTELSRAYAMDAIHQIMKNIESYLANEPAGNEAMLMAANRAGKAINITKTTAGHAMCYKLTTKFGMAHGHAAGVCVGALWPYMKERVRLHPEDCQDPRGVAHLNECFRQLEEELKCHDFAQILLRLGLSAPSVKLTEADYDELAASVNVDRLANHPMKLSPEEIKALYHTILG